MTLGVRASKAGLRFEVEVKVRASRSAVLGVKGERLSVALAAPPVDGAANEALRRLLAELFGLPQRDVVIVGGEKSRRKLLELRGVTLEQLLARVPAGA
ncbi:MAG TPA: DUF167 domain-containing protein [Polyangiaceae bacterium]|nr:DUF167 domain-containing protein [Polyangiaceae bacterium]